MVMSQTSVFKTPEGEAAVLAAYHAVMKLWPLFLRRDGGSGPIRDDAHHCERAEGWPTVGAESSHDMCFSQRRIVDARVLDFLQKTGTDDRRAHSARSVA
jgi:hypothetical protein